MATVKTHWWQNATIYEVYPSSFKDSNDDGMGDIPGIVSKIDYIADLGVDAVWLAACCKSGGVDNGYDVIDYRDIDSQYGTVEDVETLIAELQKRNIKLIMDLVVNHTSLQHEWFKESRTSRESKKRDWYIWRKGRPGGLPPNNWKSCFEGRAWTYDEATDEWYLHMFSKHQPDLNWTNRDVRQAIYADMRFWLNKGIGGFRMDVINLISKPPELPMAGDPTKELQSPLKIVCNEPESHKYLQEMRRQVLDQYDEIVSVGEIICTSEVDVIKMYTDPGRKELSMAYTFDLFALDIGGDNKFGRKPWAPFNLKKTIQIWQQGLAYCDQHWQAVWLESHDSARSVYRFGGRTEERRPKVAKMLALLQSTLGGTMFVYQGQEIGMTNLSKDISIDKYKDLETRALIDAQLKKGRPMEEVITEVRLKARDHCRAPMQWTEASPEDPFAGFSTKEPRLLMNTDSATCNVAAQQADSDSILKYWQKRIKQRKDYADSLVFGQFQPKFSTWNDGDVYAYWREPNDDTVPRLQPIMERPRGHSDNLLVQPSDKTRHILVVINLTKRAPARYQIPQVYDGIDVEFSVLDDTHWTADEQHSDGVFRSGNIVELEAYQGLVLRRQS